MKFGVQFPFLPVEARDLRGLGLSRVDPKQSATLDRKSEIIAYNMQKPVLSVLWLSQEPA